MNKLYPIVFGVALLAVCYVLKTWIQKASIVEQTFAIGQNLVIPDVVKERTQIEYESECLALFEKLRDPNKNLIFNPPLKEPPPELLDEFTQHGEMPITKFYYFNDVYSDSKGDESENNNNQPVVASNIIEEQLEKVRKNAYLRYNDKVKHVELVYFNKKNKVKINKKIFYYI